jgi:hypothetical protein
VEGESMVVGKIMRYSPSRLWLLPHLSSEHKIKGGNISLKNSKKKPKCDEKVVACFLLACFS